MQTLPPAVQAEACLGVHSVVDEALEEEEEHLAEEGQAGADKGPGVGVCTVRVGADGPDVQEGALDHGVQSQVEVLEPLGRGSPLLVMLGKIQVPGNKHEEEKKTQTVVLCCWFMHENVIRAVKTTHLLPDKKVHLTKTQSRDQ